VGIRNDHPCRSLHVRNLRKKSVIFQDLFSSEELSILFERKERYLYLKQKNQIVISLLIYQGLTSAEIRGINLDHINFDNETIFIKGSKQMAQRHLLLRSEQMELFSNYISEARNRILKQESKAFILGKLGNRVTIDDIHYLVSTFKLLFPGKNITPSVIRQSVIANWLNEKKYPIEQVQLMSGQKWISSTARYRHTSIESQRKIVNEFHPLNFL
jgi:integrase/recombinase XerD